MPELRWSLLLAGVLLIAGLVLWDLLRKRSGAGQPAMRDAPRPAAVPSAAASPDADRSGDDWSDDDRHEPRGAGAAARTEPTFSGPDLPARDPVREPRLLEIVDPSVLDSAFDDIPSTGPIHATSRDPDPVGRAEAWISEPVAGPEAAHLVLDWPPEAIRRIVTLRIAPRPGEKFTGAALRQALSGDGFVHGEMDIFHKPLGDGRVIMSAASLTRPGTFKLATMDALLFGGLSLFAVLPGPLPSREAIDRLALVARTLAQRLRGHVHDEQGHPLTDARVAELRREVSAADPVGGAAAAPSQGTPEN